MRDEALVEGPPALALSHISKQFAGVTVLDDVSLTVRPRTVHALLGENGAGKTTLMRIAFGLLRADEGTVTIAGAGRRLASAADAIGAGLGMVHQHFTNVPAMTVAENVALGGRGRFNLGTARRQVAEIGARSGLVLDPSARAADLSVGGQQRLEIVKALARNARTLILDEPTAVLAPAESEELLRWLRQFADGGNAVVLITHKLHEALRIADDITVLRRGRVASASAASAETTDSLTAALLGESRTAVPVPTALTSSERSGDQRATVVARGIRVSSAPGRAINEVDVDIRGGEIIGIAALEGAGQRELLRALAGRAVVGEGSLDLPPSIGFVPEDRQRDAIVLQFSLAENVALKGARSRRGRMKMRAVRLRTSELIRAFDIRGGNEDTPAASLSGGNQQKLVLARELDGGPDLLVVENPTRGLDLRATQTVHEHLREAAAAGAAVVLYSSDIDEVLSLATRVLVVYAGRLTECIGDRDAVGRAMLGLPPHA